MNPTRSLLIALSGITLAHAQARMEFVDLRVQGGLVENQGYGGALTVMAGNIGNKAINDQGMPDDSGIVIGLRSGLDRLRVDNGHELVDANLATIGALGGFGYYVDKRQHLELCVGYALGTVTLPEDGGGFTGHQGVSKTWSGEFGWYRTIRTGWQLGLLGGWSWTTFTARPENSAEFDVSQNGVNAAVSLGYRF